MAQWPRYTVRGKRLEDAAVVVGGPGQGAMDQGLGEDDAISRPRPSTRSTPTAWICDGIHSAWTHVDRADVADLPSLLQRVTSFPYLPI